MIEGMDLTAAQTEALDYVRSLASRARAGGRDRIAASTGAGADVDGVIRSLVEGGALTLNFHPDRLLEDGRTVGEAMADDGFYRNQFESRVSNGGLFPYPGGDRDRWEERMFGGAYQRDQVRASERPKYGTFDIVGYADGGSPRFGSCHVRLRREALARSTFCAGDSHVGATDFATIDAMEPVLAGYLETNGVPAAERRSSMGRVMDGYIEAQVHGAVSFAEDVETIVADPSFRGTDTASTLERIARGFGAPLTWHDGYALPIDRVPSDLKGPRIPPLAALVVERFGSPGQPIDAALVGDAARSVVAEPGTWSTWGGVADTLQELKYLWHLVVMLGDSPAGT